MTYTLGDLAAKYGCDLVGDPNIEILGVASLISASNGSISFLANESYLDQLEETKASAVIINKKFLIIECFIIRKLKSAIKIYHKPLK